MDPVGHDHLGVSDIARLAGVTKSAVANWRVRYDDFPEPVEIVSSGPVYDRGAVAEWLTRREPGKARIRPLGIEAHLWKAADALRNNMDAAEYKHVVLGLIFLKYISDSFEERRAEIIRLIETPGSEYAGDHGAADDRDEYLRVHVFWLPSEARWQRLRDAAKQPSIGKSVDDAMIAIERENPRLKGVLPKDYARPTLDWQLLGRLVDLISGIGVGGVDARDRDILGRVYEYFLSQFAAAEGKKGGEFYTPRSVVRMLVEILEPFKGRIYDPCCGSGGMFVQSVDFIEAHGGKRSGVAVYGQESNPTTWRLAKMNLAIRGIEADLGPEHADTFRRDLHPDLKADFILANPPFNDSHWNGELLREDVRWRYGAPPVGNANYAWVQHFAHHLAPGGRAGFVLANIAASSSDPSELSIRRGLIENDLVECVVALPGKLFYSRALSVTLWFLRRAPRARPGEVLLVDARSLGHLVDRTHRELSDQDLATVVGAYREWTATEPLSYGMARSVSIRELAESAYSLWPARYLDVVRDRSNQDIAAMTSTAFSWLSGLSQQVSGVISGLKELGELGAELDTSVTAENGEEQTSRRSLESLTTYISRGIQPRYIDHGGVLVLNQKCVRYGDIVWSNARRHDEEARAINGRLLQAGDILVNSTGVGTLGRVAVVRSLPERAVVDSHVTVVRADPGQVNPEFLALYLRVREGELERLGEGSTGQTELSRKRLADYSITLPTRELQNRIGRLSKTLLDFWESCREGQQLRELIEAALNDIPALHN